jgi:TetR/AcrR family transcriptional regulator, mexJK operon transcriptional repressor
MLLNSNQRNIQEIMKEKPKATDLSPAKREKILEGARLVFSEFGYEAASMESIAREAKVAKGTLYNHFSDKQALFAEYVGIECRRQSELLFYPSKDHMTPEEILREMGNRFLELITSKMGMAIWRGVVAEAPRFPELGRLMEESGPQVCFKLLGDYLHEATVAGKLRVDKPIEAAEEFMILCQGRIMRHLELGIKKFITAEERMMAVNQALKLFLRAYRA